MAKAVWTLGTPENRAYMRDYMRIYRATDGKSGGGARPAPTRPEPLFDPASRRRLIRLGDLLLEQLEDAQAITTTGICPATLARYVILYEAKLKLAERRPPVRLTDALDRVFAVQGKLTGNR